MNTTANSRPLALVTGASNGIGYQLALLFAQNGYDLVATGRSEKIHQATADFEKHGAQVIPVQADLAQYDGVEAVWQEVVRGDRATQRVVYKHRFLPETLKAARHARMAKPRQ